ncbi:MAG: branched-chain amino acid ABC transporter permease [Pseudorhodoferax sp.]
MVYLQVLVNGLTLGALYACLAVGFSLVWGVLNVINMLHGSLIVLGGYLTYFAWQQWQLHPLASLLPVSALVFLLGWVLQAGMVNRLVREPVLTTLTVTFGLDLVLYNAMNVVFDTTPRRVTLDLGTLAVGEVVVAWDRVLAFALAMSLTGLLYLVMRSSRAGRAIVAVRMDRDAAALMGIRINRVYAITFAIGAGLAGACGALMAMVFPMTTNLSGLLLGKAFVVCVIGGLGTVPGALVGGLVLGLVESFAGHWFGPQNAVLVGFVLMLVLLMTRPTGLLGRRGYE